MTIYIDDFSTQSIHEVHLDLIRKCLIQCKRIGIALNWTKLYVALKRGVLLELVVSKERKAPNPKNVEVIVKLPPPKDVKKTQSAFWLRRMSS